MTLSTCGAEAVLRVGGPVQVPLQPCCIAALLRTARTPRPGTAVPCPLRAGLEALVTAAAPVPEAAA